MEKNKKKKYLIVGIVFTVLIMVGTSYAWWISTAIQSGINQIESDCLKLVIEKENDAITLQNAYPLTDKEAKELTPYTFTITNKCNTKVNYTIKLEKLSNSENKDKLLDSQYVAIEVNNGQKQILNEYPTSTQKTEIEGYNVEEARDLINGTLEGSETRNYSIKLWMDEHVTLEDDATNKSFISKIVVEGKMNNIAEYIEPILHGADPVLESSNQSVAMLTANGEPTTTDTLVPVIIDEKDGTVRKADITQEWYDYETKRWANAVILVDNNKADTIKPGDKIEEDQIESYFVWIPKYKYKIFDMGNYTGIEHEGEYEEKSHEIEIEFDLNDTEDTNTSCKTPNKSGDNGTCDVNKWMTHPAFTAFPNSHGMWVGKFETGYNGADGNIFTENGKTTCKAEVNTTEPSKIIIKPNSYSWRCIDVANAYSNSYEYERDLDSHNMKNTEWGAVAYLTQSIYGGCDKETDKCREVRINNIQNYITGYSAKDAPNIGWNQYNNYAEVTPGQDNTYSYVYSKSNDASTTGNYSGIFDMSGGAWEYVAGVMTNANSVDGLTLNSIQLGSSELTTENITDLKYIDLYLTGTDTIYNRRILGDATGELGPFGSNQSRNFSSWYDDAAWFVNAYRTWFNRGGDYTSGTEAGVLAFARETGGANTSFGFRLVLTP